MLQGYVGIPLDSSKTSTCFIFVCVCVFFNGLYPMACITIIDSLNHQFGAESFLGHFFHPHRGRAANQSA